MNEDRKNRYIEGLRLTGSHKAAALYATPIDPNFPASDKMIQQGHGYSTFLQLRQRDPEFAAKCQDALDNAIARLEKIAYRRAFVPDTRPVCDKDGNVVAVAKAWGEANKQMRYLLARHDPEWIEKRGVTVSGTINHDHVSVPGTMGVTTADLRLLPRDRQELFFKLMDEIEEARENREMNLLEGDTIEGEVISDGGDQEGIRQDATALPGPSVIGTAGEVLAESAGATSATEDSLTTPNPVV
jgi:hypothetical protein